MFISWPDDDDDDDEGHWRSPQVDLLVFHLAAAVAAAPLSQRRCSLLRFGLKKQLMHYSSFQDGSAAVNSRSLDWRLSTLVSSAFIKTMQTQSFFIIPTRVFPAPGSPHCLLNISFPSCLESWPPASAVLSHRPSIGLLFDFNPFGFVCAKKRRDCRRLFGASDTEW